MKPTAETQFSYKRTIATSGRFALAFCFVFVGLSSSLRAQGVLAFQNLNFEKAVISYDPSGAIPGYSVYANAALPGWAPYVAGIAQTDVIYNDISIGGAQISLFGPGSNWPILSGKYSVELYGGLAGSPAAIAQSGLVPGTANSITFAAFTYSPSLGRLDVSLGGQALALIPLASGVHYTLYGADISKFAGTSVPLVFSAPGVPGYSNPWILDDISFSTTPVPELGTGCLLLAGGVMLGIAGRLAGRAQRRGANTVPCGAGGPCAICL